MGTLRVLFALTVVLSHSFGNLMVGAKSAVQLFYMISGFLISYILTEKTYPSIQNFYINRYLRLYPIYFVIAFLTFVAFLIYPDTIISEKFFKTYQNAPYSANIFILLTNLTIFFQDWTMFTGVENHNIVFVKDFWSSKVPLYPALLVPQGWTLGVELTFYLLAPFILLKKRILVTLLVFSILLRIYLNSIGLDKDPWTYRFFPTELAFFLLGALSQQLLLPSYKKFLSLQQITNYSNFVTYFLIFITIIFSIISIEENIKTYAFYIFFLLLMPLTFCFQNGKKWDQWVGDLSYPIYINHMIVIYIVTFILQKKIISDKFLTWGLFELNKEIIGTISVFFSIIFAICLNKYIAIPIEKLRSKYRNRVD